MKEDDVDDDFIDDGKEREGLFMYDLIINV